MVETEIIETKKGAALGIRVEMQKGYLLLIRAEKGILGNEYVDENIGEKYGDVMAIVKGAQTFEALLENRVTYATAEAKKLGIKEGMKGKEALELMI